MGSEVAAKSSSVSPEDDHVDEPEKQGPLEKTSSNVRKLVGAFESNLVQAPVKLSTIKPEEKKVGKGGYLKDSDRMDLPEAAEPISGRRMKLFVAGDSKAAGKREEKIGSGRSSVRNIFSQAANRLSQSTPEATESRILDSSPSEWGQLSVDMESLSTVESVGISGRAYSFGLSSEKQLSYGSSSYVEGRSKNDSAEISVQVASIGKPKSIEYRQEELFHFENSGMWIFPNDRKHLCITTAGKRVMNLLGGHNAGHRSYQKNKSSAVSAGYEDKISSAHRRNEDKKTQNPRNSRSGSSSSDAFGGLVQQAIKAAIVVGFGVLVFLTRQRDSRKRNKDTEDLLFEASEYTDEQILTGAKIDLQ